MLMIPLASAAGTVPDVPLVAIAPFVLLLLMIATMPFLHKHWWERNYPWVSVGLGLVTVAYYIFGLHDAARVAHTAMEYVSFIGLIGALFVVAGGVQIAVKGESTPLVNVVFLWIGAVLANIIGTTGASMLMIRPWLRINKYRITSFHTVFFIFVVSNAGGCLTPIGDPPLFLGFLKGIPFWWSLEHLWRPWALTIALVTGVFYVFDRANFLRAPKEVRVRETASETWQFRGVHNVLLLGVVLAAVFQPSPWRELVMAAAAVASYFTTPKPVHKANDFTFQPIQEVAWLFAGIFATMMPALDFLNRHAGSLGIDTPLEFYFVTGALSSVLDNAPTYLTLLAAELGLHHRSIDLVADVLNDLAEHPREIAAISMGAVFFGAMTYIGNGPNFMVKAIAERAGARVPSFFGYIFFFSVPVLLPILAFVGWVYLR